MAKYLDDNGLLYFWQKIKTKIAEKTTMSAVEAKGYQTSSEVDAAITAKGYTTIGIVEAKGYQTATEVESAITEKGYQTSTQVESAITSKGYQTATQIESTITEKGYQTSTQVENAITEKGYQTSTQVEEAITNKGYQTATEVNTAITNALANIKGVSYQKVTVLPAQGEVGVIYLIPKTAGENDIYQEYIWVDPNFEYIGDSNQITIDSISNGEIDTILAK